jgi:hypothetical protein
MERLTEILPSIAKELENVLFDMGEYQLAKTVDDLEVVDRCRCGDDACGTFYTVNKSEWRDKPVKHLIPGCDGLYEVDVYDGTIVCVEILERDDVSEVLRKRLP